MVKGDAQDMDEEFAKGHDVVDERNEDKFSNHEYNSDEINQYQNEEKSEEDSVHDENYDR